MMAANLDPVLLSRAVEAARRALRRLDEGDIPPKLRAIAGRSGRLPAPFARSLLTELDSSAWLRAKALDELEAGADTALEQPSAAVLFLQRPENWTEDLETLARGRDEDLERSEVKRLETQLRRAIARSGTLEQKLAKAERREQEAASEAEQRLAAAASAQRRSQSKLKTSRDKFASQLATAEEDLARLTAENAELRNKVKEARTKATRAANPTGSRRVEAAWSLSKPIEMGRHLDDINRALAMAPARSAQSSGGGPGALPQSSGGGPGALPQSSGGGPGALPQSPGGPVAEPIRLPDLPAGIRPDSAEAIAWLLAVPGPVNVAIDGWNAAHLLESPPLPATRNKIIEAARRIILASADKRQVTAVFDSSQLGESFSADEVVVTFVGSADEELIGMAKRDSARLVVITSDRRVREAAEEAGAVGLWSEALIEWLKGSRTFK